MDTVDTATRSRIMSRVRQRNTEPETRLRSALHRLGLRYRLHVADLPGRPDLVFARFNAVVFVHGCFWHRHGCRYATMPTTRRRFWQKKFSDNQARDAANVDGLILGGWRVGIVWECALKHHGHEPVAAAVRKWLRGRSPTLTLP